MGIVYNAGEANSRAQVDRLKREIGTRNWQIIPAIVTKPTDVSGALQNLVGKVQAVYVPNDNTVVSTFEVVHRFSRETRLPVFASDALQVDRGALAAVGVDYYESGKVAADMVRRILAGEKPGDIPVAEPKNLDVALNAGMARAIGITVPPSVMARTKRIVE
jgi:putative ABC transport system substrate-binding protein